ncbi:hypothetical protein V2G26_015743 [Clonostachys chloroleuca]
MIFTTWCLWSNPLLLICSLTPETTGGEALASPEGPAIFTSCYPPCCADHNLRAGLPDCITHLSTQGSAGVSRVSSLVHVGIRQDS